MTHHRFRGWRDHGRDGGVGEREARGELRGRRPRRTIVTLTLHPKGRWRSDRRRAGRCVLAELNHAKQKNRSRLTGLEPAQQFANRFLVDPLKPLGHSRISQQVPKSLPPCTHAYRTGQDFESLVVFCDNMAGGGPPENKSLRV